MNYSLDMNMHEIDRTIKLPMLKVERQLPDQIDNLAVIVKSEPKSLF